MNLFQMEGILSRGKSFVCETWDKIPYIFANLGKDWCSSLGTDILHELNSAPFFFLMVLNLWTFNFRKGEMLFGYKS